MNDNDLLIKIGGDTRAFEASLDRARQQYEKLYKQINNPSRKQSQNEMKNLFNVKEFVKNLREGERAAKVISDRIKDQINSALGGAASTKDIEKYYDIWKRESAANAAREDRNAKRLTNIRNKEIKKYMATKEGLSKRAYARELARVRKLSTARIREANRVNATSNSGGNRGPLRTVAVYGAAMKVVYDLARAFKAVGAAVVDFDKMIYQNMGVLQLNREEATKLAYTVEDLGMKYGTAFSEIQDAMLTLGRAGVASEDIAKYTESVLALAQITGDTLGESAEAVASYREVFKKAATDVEFFGGKMAYIANETVLSMANFKIMGNYALSASKNMGMTYDTLMSLMGAMSKVGKQSSTIGTTVRRLGTALKDNSDKVLTAWRKLGFEQEKVAKAMHINSDATVKSITRTLSALGKEEYRAATKELNVLMKDLFDTLRDVGKSGHFDKFSQHYVDAIKQAEEVSSSFSANISKLQNRFLALGVTIGVDVLDQLNKFLGKTKDDAPEAIKVMENAFIILGKTAMAILVTLSAGLTFIISNLMIAFGGVAKLGGLIGAAGGELVSDHYAGKLKDVNTELDRYVKLGSEGNTISKQQAKAMTELIAKKESYSNALETTNFFIKDYEDLVDYGDEKIESTKLMEKQIIKLNSSMLETIVTGGKMEKALTNATKTKTKAGSNADIGDLSAITEMSAEAEASMVRSSLIQTAMKQNWSDQKLAVEQLNYSIAKQGVILEAAKKEAEGRGEYEKQFTTLQKEQERYDVLRFERKRLLTKQDESASKDAETAARRLGKEKEKASKAGAAAARRAASDYEKASKTKLAMLKEEAKQEVLKNKLAGKRGGKTKTEIELIYLKKQLIVQRRIIKEAKAMAKTPKTRLALEKEITTELQLRSTIQDKEEKAAKDYFDAIGEGVENAFGAILNGDIQGAFANLFKEMLTEGIKALVQIGIRTASVGIASQAQGEPYTAWARMAAMAATMGALGLVTGGVSGGGGGISASRMKEAEGVTTVLSDSVENAIETLRKNSTVGLKYSEKMAGHLEKLVVLSNKAASTIGTNLTGDEYVSNNEDGIWGGRTEELISTGINLSQTTIDELRDGQIKANAYMTEKITKSSWFGLKNEESLKTTDLGSADAQFVSSVSQAYVEGIEAMKTAYTALGMSGDEFEEIAAQWETSIAKLNFEGKSQAEIASMINGVISADLDMFTETLAAVMPYVSEFAYAGEGYAETLVRLANDYELVEKAMRNLSQVLPDVARGGLAAAEALVEAAGGMDAFQSGMDAFYDNFFSDAERQAMLQKNMAKSFKDLEMTLPSTATGFRAMTIQLMNQIPILDANVRAAKAKMEADMLSGAVSLAISKEVYAEAMRILSQAQAQLKFVMANMQDLGSLYEGVDGATGGFSSCGAAASSCGAAASSCGDAVEELASQLDHVSEQASFHARKLALEGNSQKSAEYAVTSAKVMLSALQKEHDLGKLTLDNYEKQLAIAYKAGGMTDEMLAKYSAVGSALLDVAEAEKALHEIRKQAELDKVKAEIAFYEDIFKRIMNAYSSSISPFNSREKAEHAGNFADAFEGQGNQQGYFDSLYKELEYEKKMSVTKEAYAILFDEYMRDLKNADYVEEKTTNDVVDELVVANQKLDDLMDTIEKASYKG